MSKVCSKNIHKSEDQSPTVHIAVTPWSLQVPKVAIKMQEASVNSESVQRRYTHRLPPDLSVYAEIIMHLYMVDKLPSSSGDVLVGDDIKGCDYWLDSSYIRSKHLVCSYQLSKCTMVLDIK